MIYALLIAIIAKLSGNLRKTISSRRERDEMELLHPCFRYLRGRKNDPRRALQAGLAYLSMEDCQVELQASHDEFLKQYTFASFTRYLSSQNEQTIHVWLAPHTLLTTRGTGNPCFQMNVLGTPIFLYQINGAPVGELRSVVDLLLKLVVTAAHQDSTSHSADNNKAITFSSASEHHQLKLPVSPDALASLGQLDSIVFCNLQLNVDQCKQLGRIQPPTNNNNNNHHKLRIEMMYCHLEDAQAFGDGISNNNNRGPTHLSIMTRSVDVGRQQALPVLKNLATNTRLTHVEISVPSDLIPGAKPLFLNPLDVQQIKSALSRNKGLKTLKLFGNVMADDSFIHICQALAHHPTMKQIHWNRVLSEKQVGVLFPIPLSSKRHVIRQQAVVAMLQTNTELEHISVDVDVSVSVPREYQWKSVVVPLLQHNIARKRFRAISKMDSEEQRRALLAKALAKVSNDPLQLRVGLASNLSSFLFTTVE